MNNEYTKWVACWGTATSIADQTLARYAKDIVFKNNRIAGGVKPKLELQDCINVEESN